MSSAGQDPPLADGGSAPEPPPSPGERGEKGENPWVRRVATYVLPTFSVLLAALVFLGPGALRPALGARVRGAPAEGGRVAALRVEVVRSLYEVVDGAGAQAIEVEASAPG